MANLNIRNLELRLEAQLIDRAKAHGRSPEEEAKEILTAALGNSNDSQNLALAIRRRVEPFGGVSLNLPERAAISEPADFEK